METWGTHWRGDGEWAALGDARTCKLRGQQRVRTVCGAPTIHPLPPISLTLPGPPSSLHSAPSREEKVWVQPSLRT